MTASGRSEVSSRLLVLGFGVTGRAVCDYALRHSFPVCVSDQRHLSQSQQHWLEANEIAFEHEGHTARFLSAVDAVILSPGIPDDHPVVQAARQRDLRVLSEIEFALGLLSGHRVIAVTGTNGKSSTVEVIAKLLKLQGQQAWVAGNIGIPLISIVDEVARGDVLVLEVSSYQLEQSRRLRPGVGVLLNLTPDHMQRHKDMRSYAEAKSRLFAHQEASDVAIMPKALASQFEAGEGRRVFYDGLNDPFPDFVGGLLPHERSNLKAAVAACETLGPDFDRDRVSMGDILEAFRLPHRMETVGTIHGVHVINDSKSTNAASTIAALRCMNAPTVVLLGGRFKGAGYEPLVRELSESNIREVVLFGEAVDSLRNECEQQAPSELPISSVETLSQAVDRAIQVALPGDVLLFSPACSSFDAFSDYAQRGERFVSQIRSLPGFEYETQRT